MRKMALILLLFPSAAYAGPGDTLNIRSPNRNIHVRIWMHNELNYQVLYHNKPVTGVSAIDFVPLNHEALSGHNAITSVGKKEVRSLINVPVPDRRKQMQDYYNQLTISFKLPYKVSFRVYNEGVAYRISTSFKDSLFIKKEVARFAFSSNPSVYFPLIHKKSNADQYHTSFEELYPVYKLTNIPDTAIAFSPVLVLPEGNPKIAITESDLFDYPGMFLRKSGSGALQGDFAAYPLEEKSTGELYSQKIVTRRANYIAHTSGTRDFPWRIMMIAAEDKELPANDMVYKLATPCKIGDISWVTPGKCTDEWIISSNLFNVPFRAGINTATYKYYIDFAKRFGFDRIMMDAGWSDNNDLFKVVPQINMDILANYAKKQGVRLSMWTLAETLERQLDSALLQFRRWGVDFIMTDFIDRDDQKAVNFYERVAKACAEHKIMIMYHGAYAPKGFNRTYPNAVTREGVLGSEYNVWSDKVSPGHNVIIPFTRMLAGPLDYEPGFLNNATKAAFRSIEGTPMSQGTRSHQIAMFIVYDSPVQIFSGNPSQAFGEPEFMNLLKAIPTVWDETVIPQAQVGEYIITARRKNNDWFIAGLTNWTPRDFLLKPDFLPAGNYTAVICKDGVNADRYAGDYTIGTFKANRNTTIPVRLAPGGGFFIKLTRIGSKTE